MACRGTAMNLCSSSSSSFTPKLAIFISAPRPARTRFSFCSSSLPNPRCLKARHFKGCASPADEAVFLSLSAAGYEEPMGLEEVKDVGCNKEIQALGQFAVDESNGREGKSMRFINVVEAKRQLVDNGFNYYLRIDAAKGQHQKKQKKKFGAIFYVDPSHTELLSFDPLFEH